MNTEEEIILRKFLGDHKFDKLIINDSLWLVCQAMKAYKNIPTLVENLSLSGVGRSADEGNEEACSCGNKLIEEHNCPYQEDINGDSDYKCNCCDECMQQCADDI